MSLGDICVTQGGTWVTQGVHGPLRVCIWAPQGMYLGPSGDVFGPLRGCIWATQGMYIRAVGIWPKWAILAHKKGFLHF